MNLATLKLIRNLRKNILQGHPWIYQESLGGGQDIKKPCLCKLKDNKGDVCWGIFNPSSPLAFRVLSLEKKPPMQLDFENRIHEAIKMRNVLNREKTSAYRLINGEGDLLPGIICDIYSHVAVLQFDGSGLFDFWDQDWLAEYLLKNTNCETVYYKPRHDSNNKAQFWGRPLKDELIKIKENNVQFYVDIINGQKTGFFLDQRDNRDYLKNMFKDKSVINLFSYSGGFSVYAGAGGAKEVVSVDIAKGALDLAQKNWELNGFHRSQHSTECVDVFEHLKTLSTKYDVVVCDPPSLAKSEKHKDQAIKKYVEAFSLAAKRVNPNGHLVLSSCSSHISFEDFYEIMQASLSKARRQGQILRISGQSWDHPFPHACPHLRYLKFVDVVLR